MKGKFRWIAVSCGVTLLAMLTVYLLVNSINRSNWILIEASIAGTTVDFQNLGGPPQWVLLVEGDYRVDGVDYRSTPHRVASDDELPNIEVKQTEWEAKGSVTLYYDEDEPSISSLHSDGGRQGLAVAASILTPMVLVIIFVAVVFIRRRSESD